MKKKINLIMLLIICIFIFSSCDDNFEKNLDNFVDSAIDKGEESFKRDYNNDSKISKKGTSRSEANMEIHTKDNSIIGEFEYFAGRYEIAVLKSLNKNTLKIKSKIEMDNNNFKRLLIDSKGKINNLFEGNGDNYKEIELEKEEYILKMVSKGSKGVFDIKFEEMNNIELINHD